MLSKKYKYLSAICISIALVIGSYFYFGKSLYGGKSYPTFRVNIKHVGETLNIEEQSLFDAITSTNKKFLNSLSDAEKVTLNNIKEKVVLLVKENPDIKIEYKKVFAKEEMDVIKKVRLHRKQSRDKYNNKKLFKSMIQKLEQEKIMEIFLYIK